MLECVLPTQRYDHSHYFANRDKKKTRNILQQTQGFAIPPPQPDPSANTASCGKSRRPETTPVR